jgi:ABC-2 type transport system ATP-binding protein
MQDNVVEISGLSRQFGKQFALEDVSLTIPRGKVVGLVGVNGAGKTTLIKHLLGLLRAQSGTVRVFGLDPVKNPVEVLGRIGYLSEERELPDWMRIDELMSYTAAFYPNWDWNLTRELIVTFGLDGRKKIHNLSKGIRAQTGLVTAVAHRPELLLLDEPSSGLDPIVRKDILNAIVQAVVDDGRTVLFSSHLLDEVELMSDYLFMVHRGCIVLYGAMDSIRSQRQTALVRFNRDIEGRRDFGLSCDSYGENWKVVCFGTQEEVREEIGRCGGTLVEFRTATFQEIFAAHVGRDAGIDEGVQKCVPR